MRNRVKPMKNHNLVMASVLSLVTLGMGTSAVAQTQKAAKRVAAKSFAHAKAQDSKVAKHIATFDELDFDVFSNQKWDKLKRSHAKDIIVHWPDGHIAKGIDQHIVDLKALFVFAPDTRIKQHPIKFGEGNYTSVVGIYEGTFTKPMPIGGGKFIQPTGKKLKMMMCTVGHWNKAGQMDEEFLFWDNADFAKQFGLSN
jgi:hypothetical protein